MVLNKILEHKNGDSLFNCLKISSLIKSKLFLVLFPFQMAKMLDLNTF